MSIFKKTILSVLILLFHATSQANDCAIKLQSNEILKYDKKQIIVPRDCKKFTIYFTHTGKITKNVGGKNIVIAKKENIKSIANDAIRSGIANDYINPNDPRIIAYSKLIGGGESTEVTFNTNEIKDGSYAFFCSFPGHAKRMYGDLILK